MIDRISDLCEQLIGGALVSDQFGDDVEQAATALQALTLIFAAQEARKAMARWERVRQGSGTVLRLRPDNPPTPEEEAEAGKNIAEMVAFRQAPGIQTWDPESTTIRKVNGAPIGSKAEYREVLKQKGLVEVSGYDARNDDATSQRLANEKAQQAHFEALMEKAYEFGRKTGQIKDDGTVPHGMPVIPLPVEPNPHAIKPRPAPEPAPATQADAKPTIEHIPLEKRKRVNTDAMMNNLVIGALKRTAAMAENGSNGTASI